MFPDVTNVGGAKEALKLLNEDKSRYSVVISDIKMPEMDGIELLQEIMADPELRQIPVISKWLNFTYLATLVYRALPNLKCTHLKDLLAG